MDVFGVCAERIDPGGVGLGALGNFVERGQRLLHFRRGENADGLERFRPRPIDCNLVRQQAAIEREGALERVEVSIWLTFEASAPQPVIFAFGHRSVSKSWPRSIVPLGSFQSFSSQLLPPSALALGRTVTGRAKRLMKPSASFAL